MMKLQCAILNTWIDNPTLGDHYLLLYSHGWNTFNLQPIVRGVLVFAIHDIPALWGISQHGPPHL